MKKPRAIQLSIPTPCHEKWADMTPSGAGRHCASCEKVVTDFTGMTDRELFAFFKNGGGGCGRFYAGQMERMIAAPAEPKGNWFAKMAIALAVTVGIGKKAEAQHKKVSAKAIEVPIFKPCTPADFTDSSICYIRISGTVYDGDRYPAREVTVLVGDSIRTKTDWVGKYSLEVPVDVLRAAGIIRFYGDKDYDMDSQPTTWFDLSKKEIVVDGYFPAIQKIHQADDLIGGMVTLINFPCYPAGHEDPTVAAELRPRPTPYNINLPSFKFVGRFFHRIFHARKAG